MNVSQFLDNRDIPFSRVDHAPTYTAQRLAQAVRCSGEMVAKTVLLKVDDGFVLAVLPATHHVDLLRVQVFLGAHHVDLATEQECGRHFENCELGAMPPFGTYYGVRTLLDDSLAGEDEMVFTGNKHDEAIRMQMSDYLALEEPIVAAFTHHV
jgi:Ala-tRNA(Pro) deacylase